MKIIRIIIIIGRTLERERSEDMIIPTRKNREKKIRLRNKANHKLYFAKSVNGAKLVQSLKRGRFPITTLTFHGKMCNFVKCRVRARI